MSNIPSFWRKLVLAEFPSIPLWFPYCFEVALGPIWLKIEKWDCEEVIHYFLCEALNNQCLVFSFPLTMPLKFT